jgi:hypothetical protein
VARPKRIQLVAGGGAIALLAAAWVLTRAGDDGGDTAATRDRPAATTAAAPTTTRPTTTTTTGPARPANTEWGALNLTDVTAAAGLDAPHAAKPPAGADGQAGGAAVADYDDDGDQDILLTRLGLPNRLLRNDGTGHFTDVAKSAGVQGPDRTDGYAGAVWADVDGDGHLDLFLTGAGRGGAALLRNDGTGHFADATAAAGLDGLAGSGLAGTASYGAAFDDWDHDGDLDLVVLHWYREPLDLQLAALDPTRKDFDPSALSPCALADQRRAEPLPAGASGSRSRLFTNDGDGTFTDVTASSGVAVDDIVGFQPVFTDVDGDGWDDLFVTGDYCTSRLYRNDRGRRFVDSTAKAGVGTDQNGMGSVVEDLDGDGHVDWFVSGIAAGDPSQCTNAEACGQAGDRLYLGDGTGRFTDATDRFGVRDGSWGWGAAAADLNQDGRLDLFLADGVRFDDPGSTTAGGPSPGGENDDDPSRLWVNTGAGPWPEAADRVGVRDRANGKAAVAFDADGDGDLDLLVANTDAPPVLYRNDTPKRPDGHWLILRLRAPGTPNPFAIGARVTVDVGGGTAPRPLTVKAGGSFQSGDPTDLHVGLGAAATVARIEVRWPGEATPQVLTDVAADRVVAITRP